MSPEPPVTNVNLDARDFGTSGDAVLIKGIMREVGATAGKNRFGDSCSHAHILDYESGVFDGS